MIGAKEVSALDVGTGGEGEEAESRVVSEERDKRGRAFAFLLLVPERCRVRDRAAPG